MQSPTLHIRLTQAQYDGLYQRARRSSRKLADQARLDIEQANGLAPDELTQSAAESDTIEHNRPGRGSAGRGSVATTAATTAADTRRYEDFDGGA